MNERANTALSILEREPRQHALLIERLRHGWAEDIGLSGAAVRLRDTRSGNYMFAAETRADFDRLFAQAEETPAIFFLSSDALFEDMLARGLTPYRLHQWLIDRDAEPLPLDPAFSLGPARLSDLDLIAEAYRSKEFDRAYLADVIRENLSMCVYDGERMAAFVLCHKDGEAGPMVVLPEYRRRGFGGLLLRQITNLMRADDQNPVCHILPENTASERMHEAAGYRKTEKSVLWVYPESMQE